MEKADLDRVIATARGVAVERLKPAAAEVDRTGAFPRAGLGALAENGFHGLIVSGDHGGMDASRGLFASVVEEIATACASTALVYVTNSVVAKAIDFAGTGAAATRWLPGLMDGRLLGAFAIHEPDSGSDASAITTRATKSGDGWTLRGSKFLTTAAGEADLYMVLARTEPITGIPPGFATLLVPQETTGLSFGRPEAKMGLAGSSSASVFFDDCVVPADGLLGREGEGMKVVSHAVVGWGLFGAAAIALGVAHAATELAVQHAKNRTIAGRPIGVHQAVRSMIADMLIRTDAAECLLHACAARADADETAVGVNARKAKLFASEAAIAVADLAIQVLGGHGYCRDATVERLFRDARGLTLHFKTSEWLRQEIAQIALA